MVTDKQDGASTILLVDDEPDNLEVLGFILSSQGYEIDTATSGTQALELLTESLPDLVLTDVRMPDMSGFEVCRKMKKNPLTQDIPVIFVSVLGGPREKVEGFTAGGVDYLTKPYQPEEVQARVELHLTLQATRRELEEKYAQLEREIAERRRAEQALRNSQEQLELIVDKMPLLLAYVDADLRYLYANRPYADQYGLVREDLVGMHVADVLNAATYQGAQEYFQAVLNGQDVTFENKVYDQQGRERIVQVTYVPHFDEQGKTKAFLVLVEDLTERKRVEQALQESEQKYRLLVENAREAIGAVDTQGRLVVINDAAARLFGHSPEELVGKTLWEIFPQEVADERMASARKVMASGQGHDLDLQLPFGDEMRWFHSSTEPTRDGTGHITGVLSLNTDITERKRAEEALRVYSEQLEDMVEERTQALREAQEQLVRQEKLAVLGQLAGGVGHELRNPLGVISNAIYFLQMTLSGADEKVHEYLSIISREVRNSEKIVADLLDFSRIKSPDRQLVSIPDLIERTLARYSMPPNVEVIADSVPGLPSVYVDPRHLEQVLLNLIANGCQAMPDGGRLTIRATTKNGGVRISVTDTGCGIPPEHLEQLFEPLFTTKARGIGLGLAVSRRLVEANEGQIEVVRSVVGGGSSFAIILPGADVGMSRVQSE